jgi:hypothetical protein
MNIRILERSALDFHRRGLGWSDFWAKHGEQVRQAEPWNRERYRRLYLRLMHLVVSGDTSGQFPPGDDSEPWLADDEASKPPDTITHARLLFPLEKNLWSIA